MNISQRGVDLIKGFEQCRLTAYMPTPNDKPTLGWGTTGPDIHLGMKWTQAEADARFAADLAKFATGVLRLIGTRETTDSQFSAMVSLAYNIGLTKFANSTLLRKHIGGDFAGASAEFGRWNKQAGKVLNGLTRRRAEECALYKSTTGE